MNQVKRRRSKSRQVLNLWVNGNLAGIWQVNRGKHQLQYREEWIEANYGRMLSLSLPFQPGNFPVEGDIVESFFDNLLPDSKENRRRIQHVFSARDTSPFALLSEIGRDCVGAIQLLPEGDKPTGWNRIDARPLTELEVEKHIKEAHMAVLPGEEQDGFRISLAGAQEKTALLWHEGRWHIPNGATPTTHIMKLPLGLIGGVQADMSLSVENEWLCSRVMKAYGVEATNCERATFGETKALVVERFDRRLSPGGDYWLRLPQEDMCQALGTPPSKKYESDHGPGMAEILGLLRGSNCADHDRRSFYKTQILFWMLAAADGHAKNFSIFIEAGGQYHMTPIYDVLSYWPIIGKGPNLLDLNTVKMAMAFRTKNVYYELKSIMPRHMTEVAVKLGLGGEIKQIFDEIVETTPAVIKKVESELPAGFPEQVSGLIFRGVKASVQKFQR